MTRMTGASWRAHVAVFAGGIALGVGGYALATPDDNGVELLAGHVHLTGLDPSRPGVEAAVDVFNTGAADVTLTPTALSGWPVIGHEPDPLVLPPGRWSQMVVRTVPDCSPYTIPAELDVEIAGENGTRSVRVNESEAFGWIQEAYCHNQSHLYIDLAIERTAVRDDALETTLRLAHPGGQRTDDLLVTELQVDAPGLEIEVEDFPITLTAGSTTTVTVSWSVTDCLQIRSLEWAGLDIVAEGNLTGNGWLSNADLATLARYTVGVCD